FPEDLIFPMDTFASLKTHINGALGEWIRCAVWAGVVLQRMHVPSQQFSSAVISEQTQGCMVTEKTGALGVATKDSLGNRIENEPDALLATLQGHFGLFPLGDVLRERHNESRHCLRPRN